MSWIRIGARHCIWAAILGFMGFARLTTADTVIQAEVRTCGTGTLSACGNIIGEPAVIENDIDHFGSIAVGNSNSTGGAGDAKIDWFPDHFGVSATGSTNTIASDGTVHAGGGQASGIFFDQLFVPPRP